MRDPGEELPRVLTVATARSLGLSRAAVRHGIERYGWRPLARGLVLTARDGPTRADWALAGLAVAGPGAALTGWDALRLVGRGCAPNRPPNRDVLVLARRGECRRIGDVRIRATSRVFATSMTSVNDPVLPLIRVVGAARAVADAALDCRSLRTVQAIAAAAIQREACTLSDLVLELRTGPRNGSRLFRRTLADLRDGARSAAEAHALEHLRGAAVPPFELNVPIVDRAGVVLAVADVLWRELRAVVEIDSREFHFDEDDWKNTMRRHNRLTGRGIAVSHYPPSAIKDGWVAAVVESLRSRAAELGLPYHAHPRVIRARQPFVVPR